MREQQFKTEKERESASRTSANVLTPPSELLDSTEVRYIHGNSKLKVP